jgi:hypothetical protein
MCFDALLMSRSAISLLSAGVLLLAWPGAALALDVTQANPLPANGSPGATGTVATGGAATTAAQADTGGLSSELADMKRYFTITADVREVYDDNINTTNVNKVSSFEEIISPSILFSYPMDNSTFDARYTFGLTYYNHSAAGSSYDQDHDVVLRYNHAFSDRFNLDLRDDGGYHTDPSLLDAIGTVNREGGYYSNIATAEFTAQWTPLFGTVTSYSNDFITYENQTVSTNEDSDENTVSQDFRFAFWPTVTFAVGAIYDNISYFNDPRGYTNYTGNAGLDWQALPSLSLGFRAGGSITTPDVGTTTESPYASANVNWQIGERSRLIASYVHSVTPTDVVIAQGQESDRFTANFLYNITQNITVNLEGIYTYSDYPQDLIAGGSANAFTENVLGVDTGLTYHYDQYVDFEAGYILSDVSSQESDRDYTRNQFYLGVRGTY